MKRTLLTLCLALAALAIAPTAFAQCEFDIEVGDNLQFSIGGTMEVSKDCAEVTINLKHTGSLPKASMGHNWVLTTTADFNPVAQAGIGAGVDGDYLPAGDDRIIAHTSLIGGGESTSMTFDITGLDPAGDYTFFCSFPGHWAVMKGAFKLV